ncbi:VOC family protein [Shimia marina]|uniref:Lactoylglutathione lyase n=1 Tax=Shimia marina TaxID=321267 RepID=A0A0P1FFG8_9RHOB|nr:VOC family protein [Shimia marina]CUH53576.1 lactoylglutathione lyase [Shimia marina]SFD73806.1 hypothetical protein SAMN04488037_102240 [Shimia marina]
MAHLDTLTLRVSNPDAQRCFYRDVFGMSESDNGTLSYSAQDVSLSFEQAQHPYAPQDSDLFWKIAIAVPNIDLAVSQLRAAGVECTTPKQFRDVGYLAKAMDPEGFPVELIDHHFKGNRPTRPYDESLLGGGPHINLVTLRTSDITAIQPDILSWGLPLLSIQDVTPFGFTLYFYGSTQASPPNADPTAVENRPWLYQRPETLLEIQHVPALERETVPQVGAAGYAGLTIATSQPFTSCQRLKITSVPRIQIR